ncbi:MAG: TrmB family transcriptional regulator [Halobacteriaceae archaeon]
MTALQELGTSECEAECFVGLARMESATAKELSDLTGVPRTRVYDAVRTLEADGLVEIQHSSPQRYRAVPLDQAVGTLRDRYGEHLATLQSAVEAAEPVAPDREEQVQEVWALSGRDAIANRTQQLLEDATDEVVLVLGDESLLTDDLEATLSELPPSVDLLGGGESGPLADEVHDTVTAATTFVSGLDWITGSGAGEAETPEVVLGRLLLVDRSTILASSIVPDTGEEHAVFTGGFGNGLIVILRRLMAQGVLYADDPGDPAGDAAAVSGTSDDGKGDGASAS